MWGRPIESAAPASRIASSRVRSKPSRRRFSTISPARLPRSCWARSQVGPILLEVDPVAADVEVFGELVDAGHLDRRDELDPEAPAAAARFRDPGDRVVVGQGQRRHPGLGGLLDDLGRRQLAVGVGRMALQLDQHRGSSLADRRRWSEARYGPYALCPFMLDSNVQGLGRNAVAVGMAGASPGLCSPPRAPPACRRGAGLARADRASRLRGGTPPTPKSRWTPPATRSRSGSVQARPPANRAGGDKRRRAAPSEPPSTFSSGTDPALAMTPGGEAVATWKHFRNNPPGVTRRSQRKTPGGSF